MEDLINNPKKISYWEEIDRNGETDWQSLFDGYQSAVDFPAIGYYKDFLRVFPEAKVILTVRDEGSWYKSAIQTILDAQPGILDKVKMSILFPFSPHLRNLMRVFKLSKKFWIKNIGSDYKNKEKAIQFYRQWNTQIKEEIPEENLLVYNVAEGWPTLCEFLGASVPAEPFPKANSRNEFKDKNKKLI